ncbi:hypothetical protein ACLBR5_30810 [Escherichia coli]
MEVPVGVDALIVCHRRFFASVKVYFFNRNIFVISDDFYRNPERYTAHNAAILRTDDNVCASIAWFFIVKTIKEKQQTSVEKAAMIAG